MYIITAVLKTVAGINCFDNRPIDNVKLGSVKGQLRRILLCGIQSQNMSFKKISKSQN